MGNMLPKSTENEIKQLRKKGMTIKEIAKKLHISDRRVAPVVKQLEANAKQEGVSDKLPDLMGTMRRAGKSIKEIARTLHISDRKVRAYLNGASGSTGSAERFQRFCELAASNADRTAQDFIASLNKGMLEQVEGLLKEGRLSRKQLEESTNRILDKNYNAFLDAAFLMGLCALWLMPPKYKQLWIENVATEPKNPFVTKEGK